MAKEKSYNLTPDEDNVYSKQQDVENSKVRYFFLATDNKIEDVNLNDLCSNENVTVSEDVTVVYEETITKEGEDRTVVRAIEYQYVQELADKHLFNLAFGVYDIEEDKIIDDILTNSGDVYKVFYTVLNSISDFFSNYADSIIMIRGSDSSLEFVENCKINCKKQCTENSCKNIDRRIKIYQRHVNNNFEELCEKYVFYGSKKGQKSVEPYNRENKYETVLVIKK